MDTLQDRFNKVKSMSNTSSTGPTVTLPTNLPPPSTSSPVMKVDNVLKQKSMESASTTPNVYTSLPSHAPSSGSAILTEPSFTTTSTKVDCSSKNGNKKYLKVAIVGAIFVIVVFVIVTQILKKIKKIKNSSSASKEDSTLFTKSTKNDKDDVKAFNEKARKIAQETHTAPKQVVVKKVVSKQVSGTPAQHTTDNTLPKVEITKAMKVEIDPVEEKYTDYEEEDS